MEFIKLTKGTDAITTFNGFGFFKLSKDSGGEDLPATTSLVYTLSSDGTYYIVGTGFTDIATIDADTSGGTAGSGLDSTWSGGKLVIPAEHNGLPVKAIAPKAFNAVKNITEAYISDGITCIGHRAFQCLEADGFDTTMTSIRFPNTLLTLGGSGKNSGGRVLWGRQGLKDVEVNFGELTQPLSFYCQFANVKADTVTLNSSVEVPTGTYYIYMFQYAEIDKVIFGDNFKTFYDGSISAIAKEMFLSAKINELHFNGATNFGTYGSGSQIFKQSTISKIYFHSRVTFMYFTGTNITPFDNLVGCKIFVEAPNSTVAYSYILDKCFQGSNYIFINKDYVDYYSTATNWTTYFNNSYMVVFGEFTEGDTLPTQIGTTQVYNVTWYEDDNFTTLASGTATSTKRYYGKKTKA